MLKRLRSIGKTLVRPLKRLSWKARLAAGGVDRRKAQRRQQPDKRGGQRRSGADRRSPASQLIPPMTFYDLRAFIHAANDLEKPAAKGRIVNYSLKLEGNSLKSEERVYSTDRLFFFPAHVPVSGAALVGRLTKFEHLPGQEPGSAAMTWFNVYRDRRKEADEKDGGDRRKAERRQPERRTGSDRRK